MATQAQYLEEFNNLRAQNFWSGWSSKELQSIAAMALIAAGSSDGGSGTGTGITQAQVQTAIESATNLDQLEALLGNLATYTDGLESLNTTLNTYVDGLEGLEMQTRDRLNAVSFATETTQLAILSELQKHPTIQIVQDLAVGANTIAHNLNLVTPFISMVTVKDNATGTVILVSISGDSANSFTITSPIAYANVRITIKA